MQEYRLHVPTADNDGNPFPEETIAAIEAQFCNDFGGFTRMDNAEGAWLGPDGVIYRDPQIHYIIATRNEERLHQLVQSIRRRLNQISMYLSRLESEVLLTSDGSKHEDGPDNSTGASDRPRLGRS